MLFGAAQNPQSGRNIHGFMRPPSLSASLMDQNSSLSDCRPCILTAHPVQFASASADRAFHALVPDLHPGFGFQTSVPRVLAHMASRPGSLDPQNRTLPAIQKETMPYGAAQTPHIKRKPHGSRGRPHLQRPSLDSDTHSDTQLEH